MVSVRTWTRSPGSRRCSEPMASQWPTWSAIPLTYLLCRSLGLVVDFWWVMRDNGFSKQNTLPTLGGSHASQSYKPTQRIRSRGLGTVLDPYDRRSGDGSARCSDVQVRWRDGSQQQ